MICVITYRDGSDCCSRPGVSGGGRWTFSHVEAMTAYRVIIPEENYQLIEFRQEDLPGIGVINEALCDFEPKVVFAWHLSLMIDFEDLIENGMPSKAEREVVDPFGDSLDAVFKGDDPEKPNALFLARITWNRTRELIFRVYDPKPPHEYLSRMIAEKNHPRQFDYRIDDDPEWKLAQWHLKAARAEPCVAPNCGPATPVEATRPTKGRHR
jgi:hypothetical protein